MLEKILNTFFTNILLFLSTFCYSILLARLFGVEGKGWANLFNTNIKVIVLCAQFFGGSALVYLYSRVNQKKLFWLSSVAACIISPLISLVIYSLEYVEEKNLLHLLLLSFLHTIFHNNLTLLLGKEQVKTYNLLLLLQSFLLLALIYIFNHYINGLNAFIYALYWSYAPIIIFQIMMIFKSVSTVKSSWKKTFKRLFYYGAMAQLSTLVNYFNYRLAFYLLVIFTVNGQKNVGIYAVSIAFCEAIWLLGRSIALVFYARISNDKRFASKIAIQLFKVNFFLTLIMATVLIMIPGELYIYLFEDPSFEIVQILNVILWPGIVGIGSTFVFSHYFAGKGRFGINVKGTIISLIISIGGGVTLIPELGIMGAAITGSAAFTALGIYFTYMFLKKTGIPLNFLSFSLVELWDLRRVLRK